MLCHHNLLTYKENDKVNLVLGLEFYVFVCSAHKDCVGYWSKTFFLKTSYISHDSKMSTVAEIDTNNQHGENSSVLAITLLNYFTLKLYTVFNIHILDNRNSLRIRISFRFFTQKFNFHLEINFWREIRVLAGFNRLQLIWLLLFI